MQNAFRYYSQFQSARGRIGTLPPMARTIVGIFALPGIMLLLLSIFAGLVSIFVLLLLTVPVYRVLQAVFGDNQPTAGPEPVQNPFANTIFGEPIESLGRKQVEAKITDPN